MNNYSKLDQRHYKCVSVMLKIMKDLLENYFYVIRLISNGVFS
jgi:hypothetical protein